MPQPESRSVGDRLLLAAATGLGAGYLPGSPGTFGSLWGLAIAWGLATAGLSGGWWAAACLPLLAAGVPICGRASRLLGGSDPTAVVYDEYASFPLAFVLVDVSPISALVAFLFFRLLDIAKPWPIRAGEHLPRGWGIMADDVLAALLAAPLTWGVLHLWGRGL
jgi:phosphatidylglycerophosphatase A